MERITSGGKASRMANTHVNCHYSQCLNCKYILGKQSMSRMIRQAILNFSLILNIVQTGIVTGRKNSLKKTTPKGIRIPVAGLKGRCPRPLDDGGMFLNYIRVTVCRQRRTSAIFGTLNYSLPVICYNTE